MSARAENARAAVASALAAAAAERHALGGMRGKSAIDPRWRAVACERPPHQARVLPGATEATKGGRGGRPGRPSTKLDETLAVLRAGPATVAQVAARLGVASSSAADRLKRLRRLAAVESRGGVWMLKWA